MAVDKINSTETIESSALLELNDITKSYPGVTALRNVRFDLNRNELLGLVGENGAGKSTLMKILIGLIQPDRGSYFLRGTQVSLSDPAAAIRNGIGMVFQEGSLIPNLSVMENLFLCHERVFQDLGFISKKKMRVAAEEVLDRVRVSIDVNTPMRELSAAMKQMVEIARLLWLSRLYNQQDPVLILDEPTTVLSDDERDTLFQILQDLKRDASIVFVSHRLQEIVENCDRIVILKDGENVSEMNRSAAVIGDIEQLMVGHEFSKDRYREYDQAAGTGPVVLALKNLFKENKFSPLSFEVHEGEIVSLVGVVGSGKEEVCRCITGLDRADSGTISVDGKILKPGSPIAAVKEGIGHIPIDRRSEGLALGLSVSDNVNLLVLDQLKGGGLLSPAKERRNALRWIDECRIKTPSPSAMCANLSGGNQQKTVIAKWLSSRVRVLVLDHPTRGVDVGAKDEIYALIRKLAKDGIGMILMSDTLEEDIGLSNRMLLMKDGQLTKEVTCPPTHKPTPNEIIGAIV